MKGWMTIRFGWLAIGMLLLTAVVAAPARAAYSIAVATCSYADHNNTGYSGGLLDVEYWNLYGYQSYGVHDTTGGNLYLTMWCQVSVPDGTQFNRIGLVGYDNGPRSVCAWFQKSPVGTTGSTWGTSGVCTSNIAGSVQFPYLSFGTHTVDNSNGSYYVAVWFIPGAAQGAGAWAFNVQLWYSAGEYDDPADGYRCVESIADPQVVVEAADQQ